MRINYFDGLKGVAALVVMLTHFVLCFNHLSSVQYVPIIGMLFDGGMAVFVFVILSAFGICCSLDRDDVEKTIVRCTIKRYFRLTLPLIIPSVLAFVVTLIGIDYHVSVGDLTNNGWTKTLLPEHAEIKQLTSGVLVGVLKGSALINPLWMMQYIFWGTFITIPLFYTIRNITKLINKIFVLLFFCIIFYSVSPYYSAIVLGIILFFLHSTKKKDLGRTNIFISITALFIVVALHFYDVESTKFARAVFIVVSLEYGISFQKIFSTKLLLRLNDISYQLYLTHATVLATVCCYIYIQMTTQYLKIFLMFIMFITISVLFSIAFTKVDRWINKSMNSVYNQILS